MEAVGHIPQKVTRPLLAFVFDIQSQCAAARVHGLLHVAGGHHGTHFIAPQVHPPDGLEHFDALHPPSDFGFPQNGLEHRSGGRRRDHVIRDALHLHFRAGKAGERACDFKAKRGHGVLQKVWSGHKSTGVVHIVLQLQAQLGVVKVVGIGLHIQPRHGQCQAALGQHLVGQTLGNGHGVAL